jgi:hypothetical protein
VLARDGQALRAAAKPSGMPPAPPSGQQLAARTSGLQPSHHAMSARTSRISAASAACWRCALVARAAASAGDGGPAAPLLLMPAPCMALLAPNRLRRLPAYAAAGLAPRRVCHRHRLNSI